nr:MAG TPA: hypothetical protein [Crassvirales sp.]
MLYKDKKFLKYLVNSKTFYNFAPLNISKICIKT